MDFRLLAWQGPFQLQDIEEMLPDSPGLYLFTNSCSLFVVDVHRNNSSTSIPLDGFPAIIYGGMTNNSLRLRLKIHAHGKLSKIAAEIGTDGIYIYVAECEDPALYEQEMLTSLRPLLNQFFERSDLARGGSSPLNVEAAISELQQLLTRHERQEACYQKLFMNHPWLLGLQYSSVQRHRSLDDENIPDFTATRLRDEHLDVIEIKQPFMPIDRNSGGLSSQFNDAWNKAERYLDFARTESDYLRRRKGLHFDSPICHLIIGGGYSDESQRMIRAKQRLNPAIVVVTYDQILSMAIKLDPIVRALVEKR